MIPGGHGRVNGSTVSLYTGAGSDPRSHFSESRFYIGRFTVKRLTPQRRAIVEVLGQARGPLTPQEITELAATKQPGIGLATVYRNLATLERSGQIRPVDLPGEPRHYEPTNRGHHHHFKCRSCEVVYELPTECPVQALEGATLPGGFHVEDHHLTFYGVCPTCA